MNKGLFKAVCLLVIGAAGMILPMGAIFMFYQVVGSEGFIFLYMVSGYGGAVLMGWGIHKFIEWRDLETCP